MSLSCRILYAHTCSIRRSTLVSASTVRHSSPYTEWYRITLHRSRMSICIKMAWCALSADQCFSTGDTQQMFQHREGQIWRIIDKKSILAKYCNISKGRSISINVIFPNITMILHDRYNFCHCQIYGLFDGSFGKTTKKNIKVQHQWPLW